MDCIKLEQKPIFSKKFYDSLTQEKYIEIINKHLAKGDKIRSDIKKHEQTVRDLEEKLNKHRSEVDTIKWEVSRRGFFDKWDVITTSSAEGYKARPELNIRRSRGEF
tara:strand:- start:469 stop:789 length:321 start_codon:yes stop_codon:yes gene_type:complete